MSKIASNHSVISLMVKLKPITVTKFERTSPYGTCYNQKVLVNVGDKVKKGDVIN